MYSLLLIIIYIAFISLGLPDSLLGAAWPVMHGTFGVPLSFAGIISMIIAGGTIVSSLLSDRLTRRLGVGLVTTISVGMTALALFGFSTASSFVVICLWAVPYGLGAGAVDAALNNYVALHYQSRHMSWLHCFWGVGASVSPYIMGFTLTRGLGWSRGYSVVALIQIVLTAGLILSLPLWAKQASANGHDKSPSHELTIWQALGIRGVKYMLLTFFAYCALETTAGLWASSYLVENRGIDADVAARFASLFYLGITAGRFVSGFVADRLGDRRMIRYGIVTIIIGILLIFVPAVDGVALVGLVVIGLGCAPVYPAIIHSTPQNFGAEHSQSIIGIQMASAYVGSTFMPPLFGLIANYISVAVFPVFLLVFALLMVLTSERLRRLIPG